MSNEEVKNYAVKSFVRHLKLRELSNWDKHNIISRRLGRAKQAVGKNVGWAVPTCQNGGHSPPYLLKKKSENFCQESAATIRQR